MRCHQVCTGKKHTTSCYPRGQDMVCVGRCDHVRPMPAKINQYAGMGSSQPLNRLGNGRTIRGRQMSEIYEIDANLKKVASAGEENKKGFVLKKDKYEIVGAGISGLVYIDPLVLENLNGVSIVITAEKVSMAKAKATVKAKPTVQKVQPKATPRASIRRR